MDRDAKEAIKAHVLRRIRAQHPEELDILEELDLLSELVLAQANMYLPDFELDNIILDRFTRNFFATHEGLPDIDEMFIESLLNFIERAARNPAHLDEAMYRRYLLGRPGPDPFHPPRVLERREQVLVHDDAIQGVVLIDPLEIEHPQLAEHIKAIRAEYPRMSEAELLEQARLRSQWINGIPDRAYIQMLKRVLEQIRQINGSFPPVYKRHRGVAGTAVDIFNRVRENNELSELMTELYRAGFRHFYNVNNFKDFVESRLNDYEDLFNA